MISLMLQLLTNIDLNFTIVLVQRTLGVCLYSLSRTHTHTHRQTYNIYIHKHTKFQGFCLLKLVLFVVKSKRNKKKRNNRKEKQNKKRGVELKDDRKKLRFLINYICVFCMSITTFNNKFCLLPMCLLKLFVFVFSIEKACSQ